MTSRTLSHITAPTLVRRTHPHTPPHLLFVLHHSRSRHNQLCLHVPTNPSPTPFPTLLHTSPYLLLVLHHSRSQRIQLCLHAPPNPSSTTFPTPLHTSPHLQLVLHRRRPKQLQLRLHALRNPCHLHLAVAHGGARRLPLLMPGSEQRFGQLALRDAQGAIPCLCHLHLRKYRCTGMTALSCDTCEKQIRQLALRGTLPVPPPSAQVHGCTRAEKAFSF